MANIDRIWGRGGHCARDLREEQLACAEEEILKGPIVVHPTESEQRAAVMVFAGRIARKMEESVLAASRIIDVKSLVSSL